MDICIIPYLSHEKEIALKTQTSVLRHNPTMKIILVDGIAPVQIPVSKKLTWVLFNKAFQEYYNSGTTGGFYWVETGVIVKKPFNDWIKEHSNNKEKLLWIGWTKQLCNYRVGSKIVFFPHSLIDYLDTRYKNGKLQLQHTDRLLQKLDPVVGKTKKVGKSILPDDGMFSLIDKQSNIGTKHHASLYL